MSLLDELRSRREEILAIAARRGVSHIRVFGSAARGEENPESDIDLLVELEDNRSYLDLGGFLYEVQELMRRPVDVKTERGLHRLFRQDVLDEAIAL